MMLWIGRAVVVLAAIFAASAVPARAQSMFDQCRLQAATDWITLPPREPAHDRPLTVVRAKGVKQPVELNCAFSNNGLRARDPSFAKGVGRGFYVYDYKYEVTGARRQTWIGNPKAEHVWIPTQPGANKVTVTVRRPAMGGFPAFSATEMLSFDSWLFDAEPVGKLELPGVSAFDPQLMQIEPQLTDDDGNHYFFTRRSQGGRASGMLTRHAADGRMTARYEIGPNGVGPDATGARMLLGLDRDGAAYAAVGQNLVRFDRSGRFLGAVAPLSHMSPAASPDDLVNWVNRSSSDSEGPLAGVAGFLERGGYPLLFADGGFHLFAIEARDQQPGQAPVYRTTFGRLAPDGAFTSLADLGESARIIPWGAVPGPDGALYAAFTGADQRYGLMRLDRSGRVLSRADSAGGGLFGAAIGGFDARGGAYLRFGDGCQRVLFEDLKALSVDKLRQQGGRLLGTELLNQRWQINNSNTYAERYRDNVTGEAVKALKDTDMPNRVACWVHRGSLYALWADLTIGRYTFADGGTAGSAPPAAAAATRLKLERDGPEQDDGIVLDGRSPVTFVATLLNAAGRPVAGAPVALKVVSDDLREPGELVLADPLTDRDGRVRATWTPPPLRASELVSTLATAIISLQAVARPAGLPPAEAAVNLRGLALSPFALRIRRPGVLWEPAVPVELVERQERTIQGTILLNLEPSGLFDPRFAGLVKPQPLSGAVVELLDDAERVVATASTDAVGSFALVYKPVSGSTVRAFGTAPLPAPLAGGILAPEIADLVRRATAVFNALEAEPFGYDVARLHRTLAADFPRRFAAAASDTAIIREIDLVDRVAQLAAVVHVAQKLADHAIDQFADCSAAIMDGLFQIAAEGDILDVVSGHGLSGLAVGRLEQSASVTLIRQRLDLSVGKASAVTLFQKARGFLLKELLAKLTDTARRQAVESFYENTVWSIAKQIITKLIGDRMDWVGDGWRASGKKPLIDAFHSDAQAELSRAAERWGTNRIAWSGRLGPALGTLYLDLSTARDRIVARQYDLDLYRTDLDLAFASIGNGIRIGATLFGSPAAGKVADEGIGALEGFYRFAAAGTDAYVGLEWLAQYELARSKMGQFARLAIGGAGE